jgi:hypothetical protein
MRDGSHVRLLVVPRGPIAAITGVLADGWFWVVFPFVPSLRFRRHERPLLEVNQPTA